MTRAFLAGIFSQVGSLGSYGIKQKEKNDAKIVDNKRH